MLTPIVISLITGGTSAAVSMIGSGLYTNHRIAMVESKLEAAADVAIANAKAIAANTKLIEEAAIATTKVPQSDFGHALTLLNALQPQPQPQQQQPVSTTPVLDQVNQLLDVQKRIKESTAPKKEKVK